MWAVLLYLDTYLPTHHAFMLSYYILVSPPPCTASDDLFPKNMVAIAICVLFSGLSIVIFGHFDGLLTDSPSIVSLSPLALY